MDTNWDHLGEEDDEEEEVHTDRWGTKDGLILLIDCTESMFKKEEGNDTNPFEHCIKCAKCVIQNKIISSDKDLLGIVFFGTEKANNPSDFKHVYILLELGVPGADIVLKLEAFLFNPDTDNFQKNYGHSKDFSLSDALWTCFNMFSNCKQKLGYKRVMLFTNNDDPHEGNPHLQRQAATKVCDLHLNNISIELMHMNQPDHEFDVNAFYKDLLYMDDDEKVIMPDPSERFEELLRRVHSKDHKKRALGRVRFSLGQGVEFSVGIYNLLRSCSRPPAIKLYRKNNEEVKSVTKTYLSDTAEILMPQDIKKCQTYAGKKICFEQEEVAQMKQFNEPGIKLMGFKPSDFIKSYFHVRPAQFIYPDDTTVEGSTTLFTALLKKCLERNVIAICRYTPRKNASPQFVALMPQEEVLDEKNVQITPPGFHVLFLPFADDMRKPNIDRTFPKANSDQIEKAKEIVKNLTFKKFSCENFENPVLQKHYANIEAIALERDITEEIIDYTLPQTDVMHKKVGDLVKEFKELVFPEDYVPGQKRKAAGTVAGKRARMDPVDIDVEAEAKAGRIARLTVAVLKEYIKQRKIKTTSTKKADLIDAIAEYLELP